MRRRELLPLLAVGMMAARAVRAQQKATPVVGFLGSSSFELRAPNVSAFRQGLSETGYVEGENVAIEYRWAEGDYDRLPALAADFVLHKVDVIAALGLPSALAAKRATSTIPIVFSIGDPVERGLVTSLARPSGNLTGISLINVELMPKRLELLSELVPHAGVIALLVNPDNSNTERNVRDMEQAARAKGGAAQYSEGQHGKRDRRRLCYHHPTTGRRSSSNPIRSSTAGLTSCLRWHHAMASRRSTRCESSPWLAA